MKTRYILVGEPQLTELRSIEGFSEHSCYAKNFELYFVEENWYDEHTF